jgi:hypothetical protein
VYGVGQMRGGGERIKFIVEISRNSEAGEKLLKSK